MSARVSECVRVCLSACVSERVCACLSVCVCVCVSYGCRRVHHSQVVAIEHGAPKGGEERYSQQGPGQVLQRETDSIERGTDTDTDTDRQTER